MEMGLDRLQPGKTALVTQICLPKAIEQRLRRFGLTVGTPVQCCYRSPGGKVTALGFSGTVVAVRTGQLGKIRVRC